ncbi:hypothetical protein [Candidatus Methanoperedens nitratireducens]|uniref:Uncharacterized protein n=1 Tax=Candidatus Methanoperedens nitratireducens TaxID=1392998 RepID=A0A284VI89_9EURY|nr:hypothetical protein [Candidatus Methanoperedens nitroreducens]SNQ58983.1 membrane hypothetical protein [Candidatus Methanoperedens nitroreducens]
MELNAGTVIAGIDLVVGIVIVFLYVKILGSLTRKQLKGSTMYWASTLLFLTAFIYVIHAGVEVAGLGEGLYAVTGLVATILLGFTLVVIDIITQMLGVHS